MIGQGPGKYDEECTQAFQATQADSVVLLVMNGKKGNGFSVQTRNMQFVKDLPDLLQTMALLIKHDIQPPKPGDLAS